MAQEKILGNQLNLTDVAQGLPTEVVNDTSPQLGGNLDVNDFDILGKPAADASSAGGPVDITSGAGGGTTGAGGNINLTTGGSAGNYQYAGNINLSGGVNSSGAFGYGGSINITAGNHAGTNGSGGTVDIDAGTGRYAGSILGNAGNSTYQAGNIQFTCGNSTSSANGSAGFVTITAGSATNATSYFVGGGVTIQGGSQAGTAKGGIVQITGGTSTGTSGDGGDVALTAGAAPSGANGGDVLLTPGGGLGTQGAVRILNSTTASAQLHFQEASSNGSNYVALQAPATVTTDRTWTLPDDDPAALGGGSPAGAYFLTTDNAGVLSFAVPGTELLNDTSPQLGANLDVNGYSIIGADGVGAGGDGGHVTIQSGSGNGTNGSYTGNVTIQGGASGGYNFDDGGRVLVYGGAGGAGENSVGGNVVLKSGNGGAGAAAAAGDVLIQGGTSSGSNQAGGAITLSCGSNTVGTNGDGGGVNITAGNGNTTNGDGGRIQLFAGSGNTAGDIRLYVNPGTTTDGAIYLSSNNSTFNPELRFVEQTTNGANYIALKCPAAITGNAVWTLPEAQQTSGDPLGIDLGEYTVAGLPAAGTYPNCWALVTDAAGGSPLVGRVTVRSDGTNWKMIAAEGPTVV